MSTVISANRYKNHRFPVEIISHAVWLYFRFCLSFRDVEELLLERGVVVTYEAIRKWCRKFGQQYANQLRRRRPRPGDKWHLDEVFLAIKGEHHYLWRAVDQEGNVLDILVQRRRDKRAAVGLEARVRQRDSTWWATLHPCSPYWAWPSRRGSVANETSVGRGVAENNVTPDRATGRCHNPCGTTKTAPARTGT